MSKPSEMSEFIKARLGRTSSKLVQSFRKFLDSKGGWERFETDEFLWINYYPEWIATVQQLPNKKKKTQEQVDLARLYKTVENLTKRLEEEKEKTSRLGDRVKTLEKENSKLQAIKNGYIAPPSHVLKAMAVYGD